MGIQRTVDTIMDLWQDRYSRARAPGAAVDVRTTDDFIDKKAAMEIEFDVLLPLAERYVSIVLGRHEGDTVAEKAGSAALCFIRRHLDAASVDTLPSPVNSRLEALVSDTFYLGIACEFALMNHPTRSSVKNIYHTVLFDEFIGSSVVAKKELGGWNKNSHGMVDDIFDAQYALVDSFLKEEMRIGFWKRGKLQANFENLYYAGALLSFMACYKAAQGK